MDFPQENHQREQYFFAPATIEALADAIEAGPFQRPACVCAPMLGTELEHRGIEVTTLDIDERFADLAGFRRFDLWRPAAQPDDFDLIVCDPPFFTVSLSQLFSALRLLGRFDYSQPLLLSYLDRRGAAITGTFARFGLRPSGLPVEYLTVADDPKRQISWFSNLSESALEPFAERISPRTQVEAS